MNIIEVLFTSQGRMARLPYLGYSVLNVVVMVALSLSAAALWQGGAGPHAILGVIIAIAAILASMWSGICLTIKRLHDLNYSGLHMIWIIGLEVAANGMGPAMDSPTLQTILKVVTLVISLSLLIVPGQPYQNAYGQPT